MKNKMIYISDEIHFKLLKEDNASQLIEKLLREHYRHDISNPENLMDKENKLEELKREIEQGLIREKKPNIVDLKIARHSHVAIFVYIKLVKMVL